MKRLPFVPTVAILALGFLNQAQARFIRPQLEVAPIDRLVKNLSEQVKAKPKDVSLRLNLARVHAMAFAKKTDKATIRIGKTNLGAWEVGRRLNLERALKVGDELGGHIVSGHVDGVAGVVALRDEGDSTRVTLRAPEDLARFIAPKGSVALNGTSLTVNEVDGCDFGINFIPHTKEVTTWGDVAVGDRINLEIDTLARYVARLAEMS